MAGFAAEDSLIRIFVAVFIAALALSVASCGAPSNPPCGPGNCPSGCCDSTGQCAAGDQPAACGTGGAACSSCGAGTCVQRSCAPFDAGGPYYCSDVTPLINVHCAACHGDTFGSGRFDFKLTVYDDYTTDAGTVFGAKTMAPSVSGAISSGFMPLGGGTITAGERQVFVRWVEAGALFCADAGR